MIEARRVAAFVAAMMMIPGIIIIAATKALVSRPRALRRELWVLFDDFDRRSTAVG